MAYVPYGDLFTLHRRLDAWPEDAVRFIACGVVLALEALREAGLMHRDVKLTNVGVSALGYPVLLDLGSCAHLLPPSVHIAPLPRTALTFPPPTPGEG